MNLNLKKQDEYIAYCGVNCLECTDYENRKCPGCRQTDWQENDMCLPVKCCRKQDIFACGNCSGFPCEDMQEFYRESESHRQAYQRMRGIIE